MNSSTSVGSCVLRAAQAQSFAKTTPWPIRPRQLRPGPTAWRPASSWGTSSRPRTSCCSSRPTGGGPNRQVGQSTAHSWVCGKQEVKQPRMCVRCSEPPDRRAGGMLRERQQLLLRALLFQLLRRGQRQGGLAAAAEPAAEPVAAAQPAAVQQAAGPDSAGRILNSALVNRITDKMQDGWREKKKKMEKMKKKPNKPNKKKRTQRRFVLDSNATYFLLLYLTVFCTNLASSFLGARSTNIYTNSQQKFLYIIPTKISCVSSY